MPFPLPQSPLTEAEIADLVRTDLGFDPPTECLPGIGFNLTLLAEHLRRLEGTGE
jgi:hypothetical protein